jgi:hypothetical protein
MKQTAVLSVTVEYDDSITDADLVCEALDTLLENALSTDGVLDEVGTPEVGSLHVVGT